MNSYLLKGIVYLLTTAGPLWAQEPLVQKTSSDLTLTRALQVAFDNNQQLKAAEANVRALRAKVGPTGALEDPVLGVKAMNFPENELKTGVSEMTGVEVSLSQKLPFPGKRGRLRDAASLMASAEQHLLDQRKWELARDVTAAYYEVYLAAQKEQLIKAQKSLLGQILAASRNQYSLGKLPQAAVLNLQVEEANLIEELLAAESDLKVQMNELSHLMGHTEEHLMGRPTAVVRTMFDVQSLNEKDAVQFVLKNSPRLKAMSLKLQAQEAELSFAKKGYFPDFQVMVGYTFREPTRMEPNGGTDFVSAGVGVTLPIWAASKQSELVKVERAETTKAIAELSDLKLMLEHEARAKFVNLLEAKKRIELFDGGLLQLTQQAVTSNRTAYLTGKVDYSSLLESLRTQYRTQFSYQKALAQFENQVASLEALAAKRLGAP